jgi:hypothetical protein
MEESFHFRDVAIDHNNKNTDTDVDDSSRSTSSNPEKKNEQTPARRTDVVCCCTGIPNAMEKERFFQMVIGLGGQSTRDLDVRTNTHLVAYKPTGDKYWSAVLSNQKNTNSIHNNIRIVKPSWLEASWKCRTFVDETDHEWNEKNENKAVEHHNDENQLQLPLGFSSIGMEIRDILSQNDTYYPCNNGTSYASLLFASCHFHVLGFKNSNKKQDDPGFFLDLTKLLRRYRGTIYWELDPPERITHIVCKDGSIDPTTRCVRACVLACECSRLSWGHFPFVFSILSLHQWKFIL